MRRVENITKGFLYKVGVPIGSYIRGYLVVGKTPCSGGALNGSCRRYYKNFDICGGSRYIMEGSKPMCAFFPKDNMLVLKGSQPLGRGSQP